MHPLSRLGAAVFALAFLVGIPYVLLWYVPWPELPPSWDVAMAHLRGRRLPPGVPTAALISALWVLWGLFALAMAAEITARLRGVPLRLRPLGPLQAVAATAVAATAVTPAAAFADTVEEAVDRGEEESGAAREDGVPSAPTGDRGEGSVERTRTVSGFELGSAELTERMRDDLAPTVEMLGDHWDEDVPVEITGHTDPSGDPDRNQELSEERARAVADYLEESLGEDAPDTDVRGVGSDQPVEGPPESQRRVEIAYTLAPAPAPAPQQESGDDGAPEEAAAPAEVPEEEAEPPVVTVENASAVTEDGQDGPRVVVLQIPDGAVAGAVGFAGLAGGYLLGRRGSFVPRMALSLPRPRLLTGRPRRLELTSPPARPVPDDEIDERVTVELDHVPGLGLTGKGADAAARRLIANALDPFEPLAVRVLITEREAVRLLGETGRDLLRERPCEPVTMVPTMQDALSVLASELHAMAEEERAPLALITSPDPQHEHALSGLLLHGQHRGVTAVILGSWPLGGNCVVDLDGLISQTSQPLSTLFHCSWAGSTPEEVHEAVLAYHEADHALSERPERPSSRRDTEAWEAERERPVLVAEDWDDDDAFTPVGDDAVWDRLTRAWDEESESFADDGFGDEETWSGGREATWDEDTDAAADRDREGEHRTAPDDGVSVDAVFRGVHGQDADTATGTGAREAAVVDDHDDSWWDETPTAAPVADREGTVDGDASSTTPGGVAVGTGTERAEAPVTDLSGEEWGAAAEEETARGAEEEAARVREPGDATGAENTAAPSAEEETAAEALAGSGVAADPVADPTVEGSAAAPGTGSGDPLTDTDAERAAAPVAEPPVEVTASAPSPADSAGETAAPIVPVGNAAAGDRDEDRAAASAEATPAEADSGAEHAAGPFADLSGESGAHRDGDRGTPAREPEDAVGTGDTAAPSADTAAGADTTARASDSDDAAGPGTEPASEPVANPTSEGFLAALTEEDRAATAARRKGAARPAAPAAAARNAAGARRAPKANTPNGGETKVRHERVPGRKAGRVRVVRVDRPTVPEQGERSTRDPVRPRAAQPPKDTGATRRAQQQARAAVAAQVLVGQEEAPPSERPQPAKPRKAGRGRAWRPREED
ncbi:OmpA family protein [Nocardiopsis lambiniae]|uniref:OmpA family protein n=1 Tax=Nocardiopsis lambiniae TaxID=3075539 RepID=A0ABU2MER7_9ACTN|nr:OmpA family protein [Nocardiopsis sp. DSM 44743]MDT0331187.1 OmpA family protein [Nocardiopsis sp. DSM 44743]